MKRNGNFRTFLWGVFWQRKGDKVGDKETILFALVHSGCKQNTGDTESSVSKRQPDLIAGLGVRATVSHIFQVSFSFSLCLLLPAQTTSFLQAERPLFAFTLLIFSLVLPSLLQPRCISTLPTTPQLWQLYRHNIFPRLSPALLLLLTDDCTASWRRVCLLHCAKPFYITTDSCDTLTPKGDKKFHWQICLASVCFYILEGWVV